MPIATLAGGAAALKQIGTVACHLLENPYFELLRHDVTLPLDDPRQRQPDITLARERLGWSPTVALRDGLRPTIGYFEGLLRGGAQGPSA